MKVLPIVGLLAVFLFSGCIYESALEARPGRPAEERFAGNWRQADNKSHVMLIRVFDEKQYAVVTVDGEDVQPYRAFTCEVDGLRLANLQYLAPGKKENGKWAFFEYRIDDKGRLVIRMINDKVIRPDLKTPKDLRKAIEANRRNPALFLKESVYVKDAD